MSVSTKKGAGLGRQANTCEHPRLLLATCLPTKDVEPLLLSLSKSCNLVCHRSVLFWNTHSIVFFPLKQSTFVLSQQNSHTAPGYSFSNWIVGTLLSFPALLGNPLGTFPGEKLFLGVLTGSLHSSTWIQGRSRVVWTQVMRPPVSPNEAI